MEYSFRPKDQSYNQLTKRIRNVHISSSSELSSSSGFLHSLPDAVAISCLARVSRLDHAALSLVSKSCRSLVVSSELYQTRSLMSYTEKFGYVCLRMTPDSSRKSMTPDSTPRWFILRPTLDAATGKTVNRAHMIPSFHSQPLEGSTVVALDWGIYVIGGWVNRRRTSSVLLLDCRCHKWHHVASMRVARVSPTVLVVDGKLYVLGGCMDKNYNDWGEVFDPKTQTWAALQISKPMVKDDPVTRPIMSLIQDNVVIEDSWNKSLYYLPGQSKWRRKNQDSKPTEKTYKRDSKPTERIYQRDSKPTERIYQRDSKPTEKIYIRDSKLTNERLWWVVNERGIRYQDSEPMGIRDWCVIDKLIYCCGKNGGIYWCEPEELDQCEEVGINWKEVMGLEALKERLRDSRVVHFGGGKLDEVCESYKIMYNIKKDLKELLLVPELNNFGQNYMVFLDVLVNGCVTKRLEIWCVNIYLERNVEGEIWGTLKSLPCFLFAVETLTVDPILYTSKSKVLHSIFVDV